jgi:cysteine desulfurase
MRRIYLDHAATTPVDPRVLRVMEPYFSERFGNPGSLHAFGQEAIAVVDRSRETIAQALGVDFREIIFTGSATEANNLVLRGAVRGWQSSKGKGQGARPKIIVSAVEHESVIETARDLEKEGVDVVVIPVDGQGRIDMKKFARALDERTVLVSVMFAQNEVGTIQPITEISELLRNFRESRAIGHASRTASSMVHDAWPLFHADAVQAFQFLPCRPDELGVELMTLSAHKLYGPKGVGMLYVRKKTPLRAVVTGGGQEFGFRSGTENVPAIAGFAEAVRIAETVRHKERERLSLLMRGAWLGIHSAVRGATVNGAGVANQKERLPNILNVHMPGMKAEELLTRLDLAGIAASSGSACSARAQEPSHALRAMGHSARRANESIRLSFGRQTTKRDIDTLVSVLKQLFRRRT